MSTAQTIAKNTGILYIAQIITIALSLILTIYIARYLGDVGFGKYSFAVAFTALFGIFIHLGLDILINREVARDKSKASKYLGNISIIRVLSSIIIFILIIITINLMNYPTDTITTVYIFGLYVIFTSFANIFKSTFRAFEKMEYQAIIQIIKQIIIISLGLFVLFSGYGLIEIASVFLLGGIFDVLFSFLICNKKFVKPKFEIDLNFWRQSIKEAYPFLLASIFVMIYFRIDTIMLSVMKGDAVVGWYSAAYTLVSGLGIIVHPLLLAVFPVMSRFFNSSKEALQTVYEIVFRYLFIIGLPIAIGTTLLADKIIFLVYGEQYINSIIALQILIWGALFVFLNNTTGVVMNSINEQKATMKIVAIGAVTNVILNLMLIPTYSYIGAGIATVITEGLVLVLCYCFLSKQLYTLPIVRIGVKPLVAALLLGCFIFYFRWIDLFLLVLFSTAIYFGILYLTKAFTKEDINLFKQLIAGTKK